MKMNAASIKNQKAEWEALGVKLPAFDHEAMTAKTKEHPVWVHFGAGNIFRGTRCDSSLIRYVGEYVASVKGISPEEVFRQTAQNAKAVYQL